MSETLTTGNSADTDDLMDIFSEVQVEENAIGLLSRDLGEVSMDSLLEETRRIADQFREVRCT